MTPEEQQRWKMFEQLTPGEFRNVLGSVLEDLGNLLSAKRESYGPANMGEFGDMGVLVRMSDKRKRLVHMQEQGIATTEVGESALDAYRDIAGYALLYLVSMKAMDPQTVKQDRHQKKRTDQTEPEVIRKEEP